MSIFALPHRMRSIVGILILSLAIPNLALGQPNSGPIDEARRLIQAGDFAKAFARLEPIAESFSRDRDYNYLLGVAAIDSGHPGVAQMALERALLLDPDFLPARAELGRAYIALGDIEGARRELEIVKRANPPQEVRQSVEKLIERTVKSDAGDASKLKFSGYLMSEVGHDSNINAATNSTVVNLPIFANLPFTLGPLFTAQRSSFAGVGGGGNVALPVSDSVSVFASGDAKVRNNIQLSAFTPLTYGLLAGVQVVQGQDRYSIGLNQSGFSIGRLNLDRRKGIFASWLRDVSAYDRVTVFGQYLDNSFPQDKSQNTQTYLLGGTWLHAYSGVAAPSVSATLFGANEPARNGDETVSKKYIGGRLTADYKVRDDLRVTASVSHVYSRYGGISAFFLTKRVEKRYDFDVGLAWIPAKNWTVTPQIIFTRNDASIAVTDFNRVQALVTVRRDFE